jgi:hypothetical protein
MMGVISESFAHKRGPAMNSLDDNDVIIHHGTGNLLDL